MKKQSPGAIFLNGFLKTIILCLLLLLVGFASYKGVLYYYTAKNEKADPSMSSTTAKETKVNTRLTTAIFIDNITSEVLDEILVSVYNTETKNLDYIVIPNNTKVTMSDTLYQTVQSASSDITQELVIGDVAKLIQDEDTRYETTVTILKEMLGIDTIDYYEVMNQDQFMSVINLVDAVEFNVPADISFSDSNGIPIEISSGISSINGEKAAGILFASAGYADGELGRVAASSQYLKNYLDAVHMLDSESDYNEYLENYYKIVKGSNSMKNMEAYIPYLFETKSTQIYFHVPEGEQQDGVYMVEDTNIKSKVIEILQNTTYETTQNTEEVFSIATSSKDLNITIFNSTSINGLAAKWQERMIANGYNIMKVDTYREGTLENAKIIVRKEGMGKDLLEYLPGGTIEVGQLEEGIDIQIILGTANNF